MNLFLVGHRELVSVLCFTQSIPSVAAASGSAIQEAIDLAACNVWPSSGGCWCSMIEVARSSQGRNCATVNHNSSAMRILVRSRSRSCAVEARASFMRWARRGRSGWLGSVVDSNATQLSIGALEYCSNVSKSHQSSDRSTNGRGWRVSLTNQVHDSMRSIQDGEFG